jgi:hypothetical protein
MPPNAVTVQWSGVCTYRCITREHCHVFFKALALFVSAHVVYTALSCNGVVYTVSHNYLHAARATSGAAGTSQCNESESNDSSTSSVCAYVVIILGVVRVACLRLVDPSVRRATKAMARQGSGEWVEENGGGAAQTTAEPSRQQMRPRRIRVASLSSSP